MNFSIYQAACNTLWLMAPERVEQLLAIANREYGVADREALEQKLGRKLDNTRTVTTRETPHGRVAVIPVSGPIYPKANLMTDLSGATSLATVALDMQTALADPAIAGLVLSIDSPGGCATGVAQMATYIRDAAARKPVIAWVESDAASAAYWIASACSRIVADRTACVGSIGVVVTVGADPDGKRRYREFVSAQSPKKRVDPDTDSGREEFERIATDVAAEFVKDVATGRHVTEQRVLRDFGQGGLLVAAPALAAGMIDAIEPSFEAFLQTALDPTRRQRTVDAAPTVTTAHQGATQKDTDTMSLYAKIFGKAKEGENDKDAEARLDRLVAAFGDGQGDFIAAAHKAGHDVPAAIVALREQHTAALDGAQKNVERLNAENTALTGKVSDLNSQLAAVKDAEGKARADATALQAKVADLEKRPPLGIKGAGDSEAAQKAQTDNITAGYQAGLARR